jgi:ribosomal protein S12 methylthiotransferase
MRMYHLVSLGCAKNRVDSENIMGLLGEAGYVYTPEPAGAQVIIVNTCSFIAPARQESVQEILELAAYKEKNCRVLLVAGCLPAYYRQQLFKDIPQVDALVSPANLDRVPGLIEECLKGKKAAALERRDEAPAGLPRLATGSPHSVYLKIADGCNHTCSFCLIPRLRGPYRSRPLKDLLTEAESLVGAGAREINLVAQETSCYGLDLYGRKQLPELLGRLARLTELAWIRVLYAHPLHVDDELLERMGEEEKVCAYLDLPLQHADREILRRMGRGGRPLEPLLQRCRDRVPGIVLRSTFIVGFPGERRRHFRELLDFFAGQRLERVGIFPYSEEEGTPAAREPGQVKERVRRHRHEEAMALLQDLSRSANRELLGRVLEVLVDRREGEGLYAGRYYGQAPEVDGRVLFRSREPHKPGDLVRVSIRKTLDYDLEGETCR